MKQIGDEQFLTPFEFEALGYLQEVNRRVLHPAGVDLYLDGRDQLEVRQLEPGRGGYQYQHPSALLADLVSAQVEANRAPREAEFRDVVQPVEICDVSPVAPPGSSEPVLRQIQIASSGVPAGQVLILAKMAANFGEAREAISQGQVEVRRPGLPWSVIQGVNESILPGATLRQRGAAGEVVVEIL